MCLYEILIAGIFAAAMVFIGFAFGMVSEARSWEARAITKARTHNCAHFSDGSFYYIIEEEYFLENYRRIELPHDTPPVTVPEPEPTDVDQNLSTHGQSQESV